ncbi:oxepin-CoA hydrolase, alternative type [Variovorax sp. OV329]|uniref:oxepin-CoA hydrolase, alternative type n=1 Tax=Variovorax sp. OV329 TaxID=1882825 RepID=UPI0008EC9210|nr:enoyl-CoA hydratase [Variovorax sp. OV329]SFM58437.1 Enoyl-CoA hydratase/carnithine racemase [Variovorax sp. OV329]
MSDANTVPPILVRREGAVLVLAIHTPGKRNAISPGLYAALTEALTGARTDAAIGAVVLTGADGYFCSGGDLNVLATRRLLTPEQRHEKLEGLHGLIRLLRDFPKPVVAAVEGGAAGAGLSMALGCDLLVAARDAAFSVAYIKVGLTPDGGATAFLSQVLPRQLLTELCLTGDRIGAERLHALGVVNRLTEPGGAEAEAIALAVRLAGGPEQATARIKTLCREAVSNSLDAQLDREAQFMVEAQGSAESAAGIDAFLAKQSPDFAALRRKP